MCFIMSSWPNHSKAVYRNTCEAIFHLCNYYIFPCFATSGFQSFRDIYYVYTRFIYITLSNHPPVDRILYNLTVDSFSFLSRESLNSTTKTEDGYIYIYVHIFGLFLPSPSRRNRPSPQLVRDAVLRDIETKVRCWDSPMLSSRAKKMIMMMVFSRRFAYLLQSEPNPSKCKQFGFSLILGVFRKNFPQTFEKSKLPRLGGSLCCLESFWLFHHTELKQNPEQPLPTDNQRDSGFIVGYGGLPKVLCSRVCCNFRGFLGFVGQSMVDGPTGDMSSLSTVVMVDDIQRLMIMLQHLIELKPLIQSGSLERR